MTGNLPLLYQDFKAAADEFPQRIAVIFNDGTNNIGTVTYHELGEEVMKVSICLEKIGLTNQSRGQFVCLYMEQGICLPALVMGILRQNAAFICLDIKTTEKHRTKLLSILNIRWLFTIRHQDKLGLTKLSQMGELKTELLVNGIAVELWEIMGVEAQINSSLDATMAYAIMTSGTCGNPKCVRVPHECITPNILELRSILDISSNDIIFMASPLTFDPCIVELFLALTTGASILIVSNKIKATPSILIDVLFPKVSSVYSGITILQCTPSVISCWPLDLVREVVLGSPSSLKALLLGGEPCPNLDSLKSWKSEKNKTDVYNLYGITEVSCWASIHKIVFENEQTNDIIPIGVPLSETSLQVRNETGVIICDGEGELFIGSATRVCRIDNEIGVNQSLPLFRATGDIVKIDGKTKEITYAYRKDSVIKRWGHRVNLETIEQTAAHYNYVDSFSCIWNSKNRKLGLFIKFKQDDEDASKCITQIRSNFEKLLPYSSMPDSFLNVSEIPLTAHGKVNKRKLLSLMNEELEYEQKKLMHNFEFTSVLTAFENLWLQYLCCSSIIPSASFLAQGGNSFIALRVTTDLENAGYKLPKSFLLMLLDGSTFEECCRSLSADVVLLKAPDVASLGNNLKHSIAKDSNEGIDTIQTKRSKGITTKNSTSPISQNVVYSICRGRVHACSTPIEPTSIAADMNNIGSICLEIDWKFDLGKCVDASPLLIQYASGCSKVVVGSHSHNLAIIETERTAGKVSSQTVCLNDRIESSACVSLCGNYVCVGCYGGFIYCVDVHSGQIRWSFNTGSTVKCSPALCQDGSAIVVGSYNNTLFCINILDGKQLWSMKPGSSAIFSSPCVSRQNCMIYVGSLDGTCCSIKEKDASVVWSDKLNSPIFSNPALISGEEQVLFAEVKGVIHCLSSLQGDKLWVYQASSNIFSSFSIFTSETGEENISFGCHDKHVYCLEIVSGNSIRLKWKSELDSDVYATPLAFPVNIPAVNRTETMVAAVSTKGSIYLLDSQKGICRGQLPLPGDVFSSPIVHRGHVIVGCRDNNVYGIKIS